jgi:hypothetical protein
MFLLVPSAVVNNLFLYCLIYAAQRTGMLIHSVNVLSGHYHIVLTDPFALLPIFVADLNRMVARALNRHRGHWENFWATGSYDRKLCVTTEDTLDCMVYGMSNPSSHGLVEKVDDWPGLSTVPEDLDGRVLRATRPDFFFDPEGDMPEELEMTLTLPPGIEECDRAALIAELRQRITEREARAYEEYKGRFVGVRRVLATKPTDKPSTREPRRNPQLHIHAGNTCRRVEEIHKLKQWHHDHADARRRELAGEPDVVFPAGTYWMLHFSNARVQKPPSRPPPS